MCSIAGSRVGAHKLCLPCSGRCPQLRPKNSRVPVEGPPEATGPALELREVEGEAGLPLSLLLRSWRLATAAPGAWVSSVADAEGLAAAAAAGPLEVVHEEACSVALWDIDLMGLSLATLF